MYMLGKTVTINMYAMSNIYNIYIYVTTNIRLVLCRKATDNKFNGRTI